MSDQAIQASQPEAGLCLLQLARPERMNALDVPSLQAVHALLDQVFSDRSVRAIVLTGQGRGFCAGLDLKSLQDEEGQVKWTVEQAMELQRLFSGLVQRLRGSEMPVIAALNGVCVGAGMALALAADVRFVSPLASFQIGAVKIGLSAGECGISYHLPRLVGAGRAFEIMLTGRTVSAQEAERIGLVTQVVPVEQLLERAMDCARQVRSLAPYSAARTKSIMWRNLDAPDLDSAMELENQVQVLGLMTADFAEAVQAFVHKRPARFGQP